MQEPKPKVGTAARLFGDTGANMGIWEGEKRELVNGGWLKTVVRGSGRTSSESGRLLTTNNQKNTSVKKCQTAALQPSTIHAAPGRRFPITLLRFWRHNFGYP